jgi:hypothetical protein
MPKHEDHFEQMQSEQDAGHDGGMLELTFGKQAGQLGARHDISEEAQASQQEIHRFRPRLVAKFSANHQDQYICVCRAGIVER